MTTAKVGTLHETGTATLTAQQTATFALKLNSFRITDTRSRHNDTDFVSFTMLVTSGGKAGAAQTLKKSMGDVNNGTHNVGLTFPSVQLKPGDTVTFNYLIVNSGHSSESQVFSILENAGGSLATKGLTLAGGAVGSLIPIPGLGTLLGMGAGWLVGELKSILAANCDGAVAAEQDTFSYQDLLNKTAGGPFKHETKHPGTDSPTGCGSNSVYFVDWEIDRVSGPH